MWLTQGFFFVADMSTNYPSYETMPSSMPACLRRYDGLYAIHDAKIDPTVS